MGIGKRIKEAREKNNLTQADLGKIVGVTGSAITNYENETSHPKEPILYKLIEALGVDANYLFQDAVPMKDNVFTMEEKNLIEKFRILDIYGKNMINVVVTEELNRIKKQNISISEQKLNQEEYNIAQYAAFTGGTGKIEYTKEEAERASKAFDRIDEVFKDK